MKDVAAAQAVFAAAWPITLAPLDVCGTLRLGGSRYARVASSEARRARTVIENYEQWSNRGGHPPGSSSVLFDTVAAYLTFDEAFCTMKTEQLVVDDKGRTTPDKNGRPVRCALGWRDRAAFEELLVRSITEP